MKILIGLVIILFTIVYLVFKNIVDKIKIILGYKKYEYTKILSYGMKNEYMWHKTDKNALEHYTHYDFVNEVSPLKRRIRPLI